jgi:hypothetical protein
MYNLTVDLAPLFELLVPYVLNTLAFVVLWAASVVAIMLVVGEK